MSIFNRVVVVVVGVVILVGAVITLLVASGASTPDVLPYGWFQPQLQDVAGATGGSAVGIIAGSIVIALGMLVMLIFEFGLLQRSVSLLISSTENGFTTINKKSVCLLAEKTATNIHGMHDVKCNIKESAEGLVFSCRAWVIMGSNIVEVSAESQAKIKETVEQLTSLCVAQVNMNIEHKSADAKRLAVH
ncbi:alkaline shock response membrane anchor protein AmaP [Chloroflexota bacterium]